jgi:myo-inositol 2-dehydrogenase / D-chiro-inositol 1-dehydrogenase
MEREKKESRPNAAMKRRTFLKNSTMLTAGISVAALPIEMAAYAGGAETIRVGLVGSGGRGTGAAVQAMKASGMVQLVAMSDVFQEQLDKSYQNLCAIPEIKSQVNVPKERQFLGFDGYQQVIESCDAVILATPPGFRPLHFEAAVEANKHVFMEKPLSCDGPGTRKILATGKLAAQKNLKVVVGLQNRYDPAYIQMVDRLKKGAIGEIKSSVCYYMKGEYAIVPRSAVNSELAFQIRNWHFFNWLWGGAPAGLQIHNTDIVHWVKGSYPVSAQGMGGRSVLKGPDTGEVFDHFYIEYLYEDGTRLHSQISIIDNTWRKNGAFFQGAKGQADVRGGIISDKGKTIWKFDDTNAPNAYQIEHDRFFEAIINDQPINDTEFGANSTLAAIMGRMACHSGQLVTWEDALNSKVDLAPDEMDWSTTPPILPDTHGIYPVPVPGRTKAF